MLGVAQGLNPRKGGDCSETLWGFNRLWSWAGQRLLLGHLLGQYLSDGDLAEGHSLSVEGLGMLAAKGAFVRCSSVIAFLRKVTRRLA